MKKTKLIVPGQKIIRKRLSSLKPSPENHWIYDPNGNGSNIDDLAESIRCRGLQEPLVITLDNYIVSGHRRYAALVRLGQKFVPCRVIRVRRVEMLMADEYVALLREHNRQRHKTVAEQVREELVDVDPEEAWDNLLLHRNDSIRTPYRNGVKILNIEGKSKRYGISEDKADHVKYIKKIVFEGRRDFWPLSVRGVHYPLLNYDFIRGYYWPRRDEPGHGTRKALKYLNDSGSYEATSDLITRLRLNGEMPWEAFDDPTRPLKEFHPFGNVREFVQQDLGKLFTGYWRDLLQTQPNHIEVVCEKNTVYHMVLRVTKKYQIPTSSGRGFNSIDPWHDLYERYDDSGKEKLVVIVVSDFDPEGEMIPHVGGRTLRDDFGVDDLIVIKAGVTGEQIEKYHLPPQNFAKETSSNFDWFVERNDGRQTVWELEALEPQAMMDDLETVVRSVIDIDLFNREIEAEKEEAVYLEAARKKAVAALKGLGD